MPVKLRLARHGRKKFAFYHIIAADGRAPRDGKFIEKLGIYNPNTDPATIELDFDKSLNWLEKGAQPTETVRAILSYKGVLMKRHLMTGVRKGAFSEEEAERKFAAWMKEKEAKIQAKKDGLDRAIEEDLKQRLEAESKISEDRAAEILKKRSALAEERDKEASGIVAEDVEEADEAVEETVEEAKLQDAGKKAAEGKEEAKAAEGKEEAKPAVEPVAEEAVTEETVPEAEAEEIQQPEAKKDEEPKDEDTGKDSGVKKPDKAMAADKKAEKQAEEAPKDSGETGKEKSE